MKNLAKVKRLLANPAFPRASKYDPAWILANEMGPNALWLAEWLTEVMALRPGMRVLDMGCGRAMTSVFLAREFGVTVWANDLWITATQNFQTLREARVEDRVFPIRAEAHALPYAEGFFDAIVSVDSYHYYGTSDTYLGYFSKFLRPRGQIGIVVPGLVREIKGGTPQHLARPYGKSPPFWDPKECGSFHTAAWWKRHWGTGLVAIESCSLLKDGWKHWVQWEDAREAGGGGHSGFPSEAPALRADRGRTMGFVRMVARKPAAIASS
ncbi:MAG: methyltransferase domain-containing protein [Planctomycetota bacterium]